MPSAHAMYVLPLPQAPLRMICRPSSIYLQVEKRVSCVLSSLRSGWYSISSYKHLALKIRHHGCIWRAYWPGGGSTLHRPGERSAPRSRDCCRYQDRLSWDSSSLAMAENRICLRVSIVDWLVICLHPLSGKHQRPV